MRQLDQRPVVATIIEATLQHTPQSASACDVAFVFVAAFHERFAVLACPVWLDWKIEAVEVVGHGDVLRSRTRNLILRRG
jgi:hypothetical protein